MRIATLGQLQPDADIPELLVSQPLPVPYFGGLRLAFTLDGLEESDEREATEAIAAFLGLGPAARTTASQHIYRNYREMADAVDEEDLGGRIDSALEVWKHVKPTGIIVKRRGRRDKEIYVQVLAECTWEPEHGLQVVYRRGADLSRVSQQDGHLTHTDAYNLPEDQDKIS